MQLADFVVKENNFSCLVKILDTRSVPLAFIAGGRGIIMSQQSSGKRSVPLVINHFLCTGPADVWLHYPAFKGGGESGS